MNRNRTLGCVLMFGAMVIWGSSFVATKVVGTSLPMFLALEIRFLLSSLPLILLCMWSERSQPTGNSSYWSLIIVQAFLGVLALNICLFVGLAHTTASTAGVIFASTPIMVVIFSWCLLRERITFASMIAVTLATVGIMQLAINTSKLDESGYVSVWGNLTLLAAVMCQAVYVILGKQLASQMSPVGIAARVTLVCAILFLPFAIHDASGFDVWQVPVTVWLIILGWSLGLGVVYSLMLYAALARLDTITAGVFSALSPVAALIAAAAALGEVITTAHVVGATCVLFGAILVTIGFPNSQAEL